jgi:tripartite-type tricarboxylate transporter receptor subunit TctC
VVERLNQAFTAALQSPEIRERLARMGAEPAPMAPAAFGQFVRAEMTKYEKVVKFSGARVD